MATDFQSIYILTSGLLYQQRKLDVISNNLANINTAGFKKVLIAAQAYPVKNREEISIKPSSPLNPSNNFVYPVIGFEKVDTSAGELKKTGNPLDVAINGKGFFAVKVKNKILYTRDGHFLLDPKGYLITQNGNYVLDENGNKILIGNQPLASIKITKDGTIFVGTRWVAKLKIVNLEEVKHVGGNLYIGKETKKQPYEVLQGYLEGSNVNPVMEMTRMIETVRAYEAFANALKSMDENSSKLVNGILKA